MQTVEAILERPIFGHGAYSFALDGIMSARTPAHPHQHFLQLAYEYGLVVAVAVYGCIASFFIRTALKVREDKNFFAGVTLASLAALLVNAQYSGVFTMPLGQLFLATHFGLLLGYSRWGGISLVGWRALATRRGGMVPIWLSIAFAISGYYWAVILVDYAGGFQGQPIRFSVPHEKLFFFPRTWDNAS